MEMFLLSKCLHDLLSVSVLHHSLEAICLNFFSLSMFGDRCMNPSNCKIITNNNPYHHHHY